MGPWENIFSKALLKQFQLGDLAIQAMIWHLLFCSSSLMGPNIQQVLIFGNALHHFPVDELSFIKMGGFFF